LESAAKYGNPALNHRHLSNFRALQAVHAGYKPNLYSEKGTKKESLYKTKNFDARRFQRAAVIGNTNTAVTSYR
jgi:hypothetical protein